MKPDHLPSRLTHALDFLVRAGSTLPQALAVAKLLDDPPKRLPKRHELTLRDLLRDQRVSCCKSDSPHGWCYAPPFCAAPISKSGMGP